MYQLPAYLEVLRAADPDAAIQGEFPRCVQVFITPSVSKCAFRHLRPEIGVDGASSKTCAKYMLLVSSAYDAANHLILLAWGVCPRDSTDVWSFFFKGLKEAYPRMTEGGVVMMSDCQQG